MLIMEKCSVEGDFDTTDRPLQFRDLFPKQPLKRDECALTEGYLVRVSTPHLLTSSTPNLLHFPPFPRILPLNYERTNSTPLYLIFNDL